ncbi:MAG TPA: carboxypeptidase-like regulatory domain-containing protein, partial [Puia sp.]
MIQIKTLLTVFLGSFSLLLFAQSGKISGEVGDQNHKPIEAATVSLLQGKDSSSVRQTVSDKSGKFAFDKVAEGKYLISITSVGHNPR